MEAGAADGNLTILELLGGAAITVLVFFDGFGIDQMADVEQHSLRVYFFTADFFFEGIEHLVDLDGEGAGFGLSLAVF